MSGGHWDYIGFKIADALNDIGRDQEVMGRFPRLAEILPRLGEILGQIEHDLDWDLSGDTNIQDDRTFEDKALKDLREWAKGLDPMARK